MAISARILRTFPLILSAPVVGCAGNIGGAGPAGEDQGIVDKNPGALLVTTPPRATFFAEIDGDTILVEGEGASDALTINGVSVLPAEDGTFSTTVTAAEGLNIIELVDGDSALDVPFLFGEFAHPAEWVPSALSLHVSATGFNDPDPTQVSITNLAQRALDNVDIMEGLVGQGLGGGFGPADFEYVIHEASYSGAQVSFGTLDGGASASASVQDIRIVGKLTIKIDIPLLPDPKFSDWITLGADWVNVDAAIGVGYQAGALHAAGTWADAGVGGFYYDADNHGFPCCVDDLITEILRPHVRKGIRQAVETEAAKGITLALEDFGLPTQFDIDTDILSTSLDTQHVLDGGQFEADGAMVSVSASVYPSEIPDGSPGEHAPGWLKMDSQPEPTTLATTPFGISVALDTINQALYAVWAQGSLDLDVPEVPGIEELHVRLDLPPVLMASPEGRLGIHLGEAIATGVFSGNEVEIAVSFLDEAAFLLNHEDHTLAITPSDQPLVSVTWLDAGGITDELRPFVTAAIKGELAGMLGALELPLPEIPLDAIASSLATSHAELGPNTEIQFNAVTQRASLFGSMLIKSN